ncbi:uncharacterized protein LOC135712852 [Ochlerotatus camptorhynchus]|uniref:uncharacterized protein LOC135712852 n=1 Tax=Ochlerotatus camptorhynchus TaxID=644619 RepID=UPI0031D02403
MNFLVGLSLLFCLISIVRTASIQSGNDENPDVEQMEGSSLNEVIIDLIEQFKAIMPCGIPDLGVPTLVPFELNHTAFKIDQPGLLFFDAEINDLLIDDLNNFDIVNVDLQLFKFQLEFSFFFHSIKTTGQYKAKGKALNFIPFNRGGKFGFNFNGLTLTGLIKIALNGDKLAIDEFKLGPIVNSVDSKFEHVFLLPLNTLIFNKIVESVVPNFLRDNQEKVTSFLENLIKPEINDLLDDYTLQDLIGLLDGSNSTLPTTC